MTAPQPAGPEFDTTGFACGLPALDPGPLVAPRAVSFALAEGGRMTGCYTLAAGSVRDPFGLPGRVLPILKLVRLAVDRPAQGRGIGTALMRDAFARTYALSRITPIAALVADPPPAAAGWLRAFGFQPAPGDASAMFVALGTIERAVEG